MRIAFATDWFAPRRGGIEAQLERLAGALGAAGHSVDVLTTTPGAASRDGIRVRPLDVLMLPGADVAISPRLVTVLKRELANDYDVVHAHISVVSPVGYAAIIAARTLGVPIVATFHSVLHAKQVVLSLAAAALDLAGAPVLWSAVSTLVAAQLGKALRTDAVRVLPNGVDVDFWRGATPGSARPGRPVTFVSAMRLHRKKRPLALLQAFARAARGCAVDARLVLAGAGPEEATLRRRIAQLGLEVGAQRAELIGWQGASALRALYADADGFASAADREAFGIATLEARVAGLPVIAMRGAGSSEFLRHGQDALLCDDDEDLTAALAHLLRSPDLRSRLADAAPDLRRFDWTTVRGDHEVAYRDAIAATRTS